MKNSDSEEKIKKELEKKGILPNKKRFVFPIIIVFLSILTSLATFFYLFQKDKPETFIEEGIAGKPEIPGETSQYKDPFTKEVDTSDWEMHRLEGFGLSLKTPKEMGIGIVNKILSIQNYPLGAPPPENYFKMTVEKSDLTKSEVENLENELYYPQEKTFGENDFFQGITIDRKLFLLLLDEKIEFIVTPRTQENEILTEKILSTIVKLN